MKYALMYVKSTHENGEMFTEPVKVVECYDTREEALVGLNDYLADHPDMLAASNGEFVWVDRC